MAVIHLPVCAHAAQPPGIWRWLGGFDSRPQAGHQEVSHRWHRRKQQVLVRTQCTLVQAMRQAAPSCSPRQAIPSSVTRLCKGLVPFGTSKEQLLRHDAQASDCAQQGDSSSVFNEGMKGLNIPDPGSLSSLLRLKCFVTDVGH